MLDKQRLQDELDNLELFVLPEVEGRLADILAVTESDPDFEYREQDEEDARTELSDIKGRIARLKERLTPRAADCCPRCGSNDWGYAISPDTLEICNVCGNSR